ncbi:MAG: TetR family transcriptional regulator [Bacteroidetes bacterium]|nr:TetR family transcriptional regulator [Bacteroidota bacterium]
MNTDRRTQKTKRHLAEALKHLILEKGYDAITVQDIIDKADVGRSTFYAHYEGKDQLLVGNINFQQELANHPTINLSYLFQHTRENLPLVRALFGTRGMDIITNHFTELCAAKIIEDHKTRSARSKTAQRLFRYKAEAAAGGIIRMLFKWLEDGATIPADEMAAHATTILTAVITPD